MARTPNVFEIAAILNRAGEMRADGGECCQFSLRSLDENPRLISKAEDLPTIRL
jgi:hypothetical protein